jgi:hypothetical protein
MTIFMPGLRIKNLDFELKLHFETLGSIGFIGIPMIEA